MSLLILGTGWVGSAMAQLQVPTFDIPMGVDSLRIAQYEKDFLHLSTIDRDSALALAIEATQYSKQVNFTNGVILFVNLQGRLALENGNMSLALYQLRKGLRLRLRQEQQDSAGIGRSYANIGTVYFYQGEMDAAVENFRRSYHYFISMDDSAGATRILNNLGAVLGEEGRYSQALDLYLEIADFYERHQDSSYMAIAYLNTAEINHYLKKPEEVQHWIDKAVAMASANGDVNTLMRARHLLGKHLLQVGRTVAAMRLERDLLGEARKLGDRKFLPEIQLEIARIHWAQGNPDSTMFFANAALQESQITEQKRLEAMTRNLIGECMIAQGNIEAAREQLEMARNISLNGHFRKVHRDNLYHLAEAYHLLGRNDLAYKTQKEYIRADSLVFSRESNNQILELQAQYNSKEQKKAISELEFQRAEDDLRITRSRLVGAILLGGVLLMIGMVLWFVYRARKNRELTRILQEKRIAVEREKNSVERQNEQFKRLTETLEFRVEERTAAVQRAKAELDSFLYQSAHALRRPVVRIEGLLSLIDDRVQDIEGRIYMDKLSLSLSEMDDLLHKLILLNDMNGDGFDLQPIRLNDALVTPEEVVEEGGGTVRRHFADDFTILADERLMSILFLHVFENSVRYSEGPAEIEVFAERAGDEVIITIADRSPGIQESELGQVFEMFFRAEYKVRGNGLGLYVVRKVAELQLGEVEMRNREGGGTEMILRMPNQAF